MDNKMNGNDYFNMADKILKTLNVSIQSKKYLIPINNIVNDWKNDGLNVSVKVADGILLLDKLNSSISFYNFLNVYKLIEKTILLNDNSNINKELLQKKIDLILSQVVTIDNAKLTQILYNINNEEVTEPYNHQENISTDNQVHTMTHNEIPVKIEKEENVTPPISKEVNEIIEENPSDTNDEINNTLTNFLYND